MFKSILASPELCIVKLKSARALPAAILACTLVWGSAQAYEKPPFPRLGGYLIGAPQNFDDPNYQAAIARLDVAVLTAWPGLIFSNGQTIGPVFKSIKARNPKTQIFIYTDINEAQFQDSSLAPTLNANRWWLYPSGTTGTPVKSTWGNDFYTINTSIFNTPYLDWKVNWQVQLYSVPTGDALDGFYTDNLFEAPRVNGDWNRDGTLDSQSNPEVQTWFRQGYRYFLDKLRAAMPGKLSMGNAAFPPGSQAVEYKSQLNGVVMEALIGYPYATESWGGFETLMGVYRNTLVNLAEPRLAIFHQNGSRGDYQGFRYGFASCLMDDGYYYYSIDDVYSGVNWFDEFNYKLGYATSSPQTAAWQSGVYRRDFQNGIALVNPKGNGARQVFLEDDFVKISGSQDPNVNNGQTVRSVILQDRDGIILMRKNASTAPVVSNTPSQASSSVSAAPVASSSSSSSSRASTSASSSSTTARKVPAPPSAVTVR